MLMRRRGGDGIGGVVMCCTLSIHGIIHPSRRVLGSSSRQRPIVTAARFERRLCLPSISVFTTSYLDFLLHLCPFFALLPVRPLPVLHKLGRLLLQHRPLGRLSGPRPQWDLRAVRFPLDVGGPRLLHLAEEGVVELLAVLLGGRLRPDKRLDQLGNHHLLRARPVPLADHAVLGRDRGLVDEGAHRRHVDVVGVEEVVAQVELVERQRHDKGREVWRHLRLGSDEGHDVVWTALASNWVSIFVHARGRIERRLSYRKTCFLPNLRGACLATASAAAATGVAMATESVVLVEDRVKATDRDSSFTKHRVGSRMSRSRPRAQIFRDWHPWRFGGPYQVAAQNAKDPSRHAHGGVFHCLHCGDS